VEKRVGIRGDWNSHLLRRGIKKRETHENANERIKVGWERLADRGGGLQKEKRRFYNVRGAERGLVVGTETGT